MVAEEPDKPWLHRPEWRDGVIRISGRGKMIFFIIVAGIWNLVSTALWVLVPYELLKQDQVLVGLAFVVSAAGLVLLALAFWFFLKWWKYGESRFEMKTFPGVIGGKLEGIVRTSVNLAPDAGFEITLKCVNRVYVPGRKGHGHYRNDILHQDEQTVKRELLYRDSTQSAIPVLFQIPFGARPTESDDDIIIWKLAVSAQVSGLDYHAEFEIPVFMTPESSAD